MLGIVLIGALLTGGMFLGNASAKEYLVGLMTDRTGPTNSIGPALGDGFFDYMKLFNKKDGLGKGNAIRVMEIDHAYNVPRGVEAYERFKSEGAVTIALYGTPHTAALTPRLTEDKILGTSPGFGTAAGANGDKYPYLFPAAASYWSQGTGAMKFLLDNWQGKGKPKVAYIYGDNPSGREPIAVLKDVAELEGLELRTYAVPPPYIDLRPQVIDITRRYKADWVIAHLFGRAPALAMKEFRRMGVLLTQMIGLVWTAAESDIRVAGWDVAEGLYNVQFAHVGSTGHPLLDEIRAMYKAEGKGEPESMSTSVYYNRGLATAALHAEAIRAAIAQFGPNITTDQAKIAMEHIQDFSLDGFLSPINMTPHNHEGGGAVRIFQVHDGGYRPVTEWFRGYPEVIAKRLAAEG
jgi:branched-chain amino acid transport system substrate-binding protein